ncbi:MAG: serine hydrolase, partial [Clostridia bacterium]|nr:serine hydrolase [Clostridia bacterium]
MFKNYKFVISLFLLITCISYASLSFAEESTYVWSNNSKESIQTNSDINETENTNNSLNLESESAILIEQSTGKVLYSHNEHEQLRPASVTKVMSILLIMESLDNGQISLDDFVPCSENAASMGGSQIW